MQRHVAIVVGVVLALIASTAGLVLWRTDEGRSAVGVFQRTDGSVAVVTAWCAGARVEQPTIALWEDGAPGETLVQAQGTSSQASTIFTVGQVNGEMQMTISEPLPQDALLVAYNEAEPKSWFPRQGYPSAATVFTVSDLPVTDAGFPEQVAVGNSQKISGQALVSTRCNPQFHHISTR